MLQKGQVGKDLRSPLYELISPHPHVEYWLDNWNRLGDIGRYFPMTVLAMSVAEEQESSNVITKEWKTNDNQCKESFSNRKLSRS